MAGRVRYDAGQPCWIDVGTPDLGAAEEFYGALFGWDFEPRGRTHSTALLREQPVAGFGPARDEGPAWTTHVAVDDIDEVVRLALQAGGRVLLAPEQVFDEGREQGWSALLADPAGALFAVWEPVEFEGALARGVPGASCWNELAVRDARAAIGFYGQVFDWQARSWPFIHGGGSYTEFDLPKARGRGGQTVAGMVEMSDWPSEIPPHWMVYFAVDDCHAAVARVEDLGGTVQIPPFDLPSGWAAVVADPHGAVLSLIELVQ